MRHQGYEFNDSDLETSTTITHNMLAAWYLYRSIMSALDLKGAGWSHSLGYPALCHRPHQLWGSRHR